MEPFNGLQIIDVFCSLLGGVIIPDSLDEVFESVPPYADVENFINNVLFFIVDYYRWWRGVSLPWERIIGDRTKEGDVLHRVHSYVARKI